jgi:DNA-3-methyladenine glycosylase I
MVRCSWCEKDALYIKYHDEEWGSPVHDEQKHFEFLLLETMQAGLSWLTILRKRENYRRAFAGFDATKVAAFTPEDVDRLMEDSGIIRNRKKIEAAVKNAKAFLTIGQEWGSFDRYIWSFTGNEVIKNAWTTLSEIPAKTALSDKISADMKKRGFSFVGSVTIYSHLQAIGIVNDHVVHCFRYAAND